MIKIIKKLPLKWIIALFAAILGVLLMVSDVDFSKSSQTGVTEEKIRSLCEKVRGAGEVSVAVTLDESKICGVGIVCEGGDDPNVVKRLLSLISASCDVPTNRIYITYSEKDSVR